MKKLFLAINFAIITLNINAQLVVDSLGRVGIGTETPKSFLSVGTSGSDDAALSCSGLGDKLYGIKVISTLRNSNTICGGYFNLKNHDGHCYGGRNIALGVNDMNITQYAIGVTGEAGCAQTAVGVYGKKSTATSSYKNFAGIYGSDTKTWPTFKVGSTDYSGVYAGYFNGIVRVTDGLYATILSPAATTSSVRASEMTILSEESEKVVDKLGQVQTLQFLRYNPTQEVSASETTFIDNDELLTEEIDSLAEFGSEEVRERKLSAVQYGLAADQLKAVYPELVYEDANGNVSINYVEMIPLLVQSINELSEELAVLKGSSAKKALAQPTSINENVSDVDVVRMDQNKPNPFSESTVIPLNIPRETQSANIYIYDMSGKQVQSIPVSERGETDITVYASDLSAGMFIYALVVDGKVVVTRRMIVGNV
ncbi:MAG: T9SS type A sorting domain-containing protein [Bacteroidaceae bacterium]|nr:T9SS type A sorting domain-containing protein [Bacteroidaceae bacterium]